MSFVVVPRSSTDATGEQSNSNNNNTLFIGFNQDSTMLAYGKDQGFRIISCAYGFCERVFDHKFIDGGISFVCFMDEDKSTVALVGGGSRPAFAMNKVVFYNYKERKVTNELICPRNIISIHSKKNLFVVVAEDMVYIFDLTTKQQVHSWKTTLNPYGISTFIYNKQKKEYLLTILDEQVGEVKVLTIRHENYEIFSEITVRAHESSIRCVALSQDGSMLATVSEKGTLIRVFNVDTGAKIHEFRRGNLAKEIYSLTFNHKGDLISCVSRETLHVFVVDFKEWKAKLASNNDNSNNSSLSTIWSYVTTTIYEPLETTPTSTFKYPNIDGISVCTFETNDESILVCNNKGVYVSLKFGWNSNSEPINSDPINKFEALVE